MKLRTLTNCIFAIATIVFLSACSSTDDITSSASTNTSQNSTSKSPRSGNLDGVETVSVNDDANDAKDPEQWICKATLQTGSRFNKRVCAKRKDWELQQQLANQTTFRFQHESTAYPTDRN